MPRRLRDAGTSQPQGAVHGTKEKGVYELRISTHQVHDIESLLDHVVIINQSRVLLNSSIADISRRYAFRYLSPQEMDDNVLYAEPSLQGNEPSLQGNAVIMPRGEGEETQVDLELLFNATINGKISHQ